MLATAGFGLLVLMILARGALVPFFIGAAAAYLLAPLVDWLAALYPFQSRERARGAAILTIYGTFAGSLTLLGVIFGPTIADQLNQLVDDLPNLIEDGQQQFDRWQNWYEREIPADIRDEIDGVSADIEEGASDFARGLVSSVFGFAYQTAGAILGYLVIPVWLFYVLKDRGKGLENFFRFLPEDIRDDARNIIGIINHTFGNYLRAQLFLGVVVGVVSTIGLWLLDVPFYGGLGVIAGISELIPIIGPILGAVPAILVALAVDPEKAVWVALLYLGIQQMENNLLVPRIQGWAVHMNPAIIIMLLVMANAIIGFWAMLVVIPLAAIVKETFLYVYNRLEEVEQRQEADRVLGPVGATPDAEHEPTLRRLP